MQDKTPLQIKLSDYEEEDWEVLWESIFIHTKHPERCNSATSQASYAYNYANECIALLRQKASEQLVEEAEDQRNKLTGGSDG